MTFRDRVLHGVLWSSLQKWGGAAIQFAVFLILARLLSPEAFGLVALATVFIAFVQVFVDQGFAEAIIQRNELERGHLDTAFWTSIGAGAALTLAGILAAHPIALLFENAELTPIIRWLSLGLLIKAFSSVPEALLRRDLRIKILSVRLLAGQTVGGAVGIAMALAGFGVWSLVASQLVGQFVGILALWFTTAWRPGFAISRRHFVQLAPFGANVLGIRTLNFLSRRSDDLLIGVFLGTTALGYYTVAYRLVRMLTEILTSTFSQVAFPAFARLQNEPARLRQAFYTATRFSSFLAFPVFVGIAVMAPEIAVGIFGDQWAPSIPVMRILAFVGVVQGVFHFTGPLLKACGKPSWVLANGLLNTVVNVTAFFLVVQWGITAVAAAYVIRAYALSPIRVWMLHRVIRLDPKTFLRELMAPLLASAFAACVVLAFEYWMPLLVPLYLQLFAYVALGAAAYLAGMRAFSPTLLADILTLARLILRQWKMR